MGLGCSRKMLPSSAPSPSEYLVKGEGRREKGEERREEGEGRREKGEGEGRYGTAQYSTADRMSYAPSVFYPTKPNFITLSNRPLLPSTPCATALLTWVGFR